MAQNATGATPFPLGVFVGNPNYYDASEEVNFEANFNAFSNLMKAKPLFLDQYGDQRLPTSEWVGQASWNAASMAQSPVLKDVTPVIGLPMTSTASNSGTPDQFYKNFAAGDYDSVLKGMVKAWAENGFTTQIWRPGWEMNIGTMPSYAGEDAATRADWVKAFQHIYTVLHAAGKADGVNIKVAWNPSVANYSHAGNVIDTAYPGNQHVDIIAADVYGDVFPYGSSTHLYDWDKSGQVLNSSRPVYDSSVKQWAADPINLDHYYTYPASNQWSLDGSDGHATTLQQLINLAKSAGKPFAVAETGAGNTNDGAGLTDNPTFVKWLADTLHQSGVTVSFVNIWDSNSGGQYQFTSSADHKPQEATAWAKYFGDPPMSAPVSASTSSSVHSSASAFDHAPASASESAAAASASSLSQDSATVSNGNTEMSGASANGHGSAAAIDGFNHNFQFASASAAATDGSGAPGGVGNDTLVFHQLADANFRSQDSFAPEGSPSNIAHRSLAALANDAGSDGPSMAARSDAMFSHSADASQVSPHHAVFHPSDLMLHWI
ncbi:hypothetical protein UP10_00820 [Bradyrhizobium sp. LTSPM299]|uniref:hypothetical protein n=1 Tax=Bradyrhizobium sp. LTSPM299 TaxID=1619233 RepID=UPI0005CB7A4C|nr:hypothetical protein [Bradyrhizobium sp. LTSPM299]KJC62753.1 hypothetical protein UP10_00820 [Bradyrhizobium sp. LTSPM299]